MKPKRFPLTAEQFLTAVLRQPGLWSSAIEQAEEDDIRDDRVVFWLRDDTDRLAVVAHEYGRMIVTLDGWYWFDLERLHESWPHYSWRRHIGEKNWARAEHFALLDVLVELFPPQEYASPSTPTVRRAAPRKEARS